MNKTMFLLTVAILILPCVLADDYYIPITYNNITNVSYSNQFDQSLNTTDNVQFNSTNIGSANSYWETGTWTVPPYGGYPMLIPRSTGAFLDGIGGVEGGLFIGNSVTSPFFGQFIGFIEESTLQSMLISADWDYDGMGNNRMAYDDDVIFYENMEVSGTFTVGNLAINSLTVGDGVTNPATITMDNANNDGTINYYDGQAAETPGFYLDNTDYDGVPVLAGMQRLQAGSSFGGGNQYYEFTHTQDVGHTLSNTVEGSPNSGYTGFLLQNIGTDLPNDGYALRILNMAMPEYVFDVGRWGDIWLGGTGLGMSDNHDISINFRSNSANDSIRWLEDERLFNFSTDLLVNGNVTANNFFGKLASPTGNNTLYVCSQGACQFTTTASLAYYSTPTANNPFQVIIGCGNYSSVDEGDFVSVKGESAGCSNLYGEDVLKAGNHSVYSDLSINATNINLHFPNSVRDVEAHSLTLVPADDSITDFVTFAAAKSFENIYLRDIIIKGWGTRTDGVGVLSNCTNCIFRDLQIFLGKSDDNSPTCIYAGSGINNLDKLLWKGMYCNINNSQNLSTTDVSGMAIHGGNHLVDGAVFDISTPATLNDHNAGIWCDGGSVTVINSYFDIHSSNLTNVGIEVDSGCTLNFGSGNTFSDAVNVTIQDDGGTINYLRDS